MPITLHSRDTVPCSVRIASSSFVKKGALYALGTAMNRRKRDLRTVVGIKKRNGKLRAVYLCVCILTS